MSPGDGQEGEQVPRGPKHCQQEAPGYPSFLVTITHRSPVAVLRLGLVVKQQCWRTPRGMELFVQKNIPSSRLFKLMHDELSKCCIVERVSEETGRYCLFNADLNF